MRVFISTVILLSSCLVFQSASIAASECNKEFMSVVNKNPSLTEYQKETALNDACLGKLVIANGKVKDVKRKDYFDLVGDDGIEYGVKLNPGNKCGDLLRFSKGQPVSVSGRVTHVWGSIFSKQLGEADCR